MLRPHDADYRPSKRKRPESCSTPHDEMQAPDIPTVVSKPALTLVQPDPNQPSAPQSVEPPTPMPSVDLPITSAIYRLLDAQVAATKGSPHREAADPDNELDTRPELPGALKHKSGVVLPPPPPWRAGASRHSGGETDNEELSFCPHNRPTSSSDGIVCYSCRREPLVSMPTKHPPDTPCEYCNKRVRGDYKSQASFASHRSTCKKEKKAQSTKGPMLIGTSHRSTCKKEKKAQSTKGPILIGTGDTQGPMLIGTGDTKGPMLIGTGDTRVYVCMYCNKTKLSMSKGQDGRVRIRCECGGRHQDGEARMHAQWSAASSHDQNRFSASSTPQAESQVATDCPVHKYTSTTTTTSPLAVTS